MEVFLRSSLLTHSLPDFFQQRLKTYQTPSTSQASSVASPAHPRSRVPKLSKQEKQALKSQAQQSNPTPSPGKKTLPSGKKTPQPTVGANNPKRVLCE